MPECGSQCWLCDLPVHFDTYKGCTHDCKYCFARKHGELEKIEFKESAESLRKFVYGNRTNILNWCDWDIPLHIGGLSDPFQPCEKKYRRTMECLEVLAESQYPFVISTKGSLCATEEYLNILSKCNVCMQVSAVCTSYDKMEKGAPTFVERLEVIRKLAERVKRVNVRVQSYMHEVYGEVFENIKKFADAGAYGIVFEGMKFTKKKPGLIKSGGDFCYPPELLISDFTKLRDECHKHGLKFYSGENRLRRMGDSLTCCGIDGMEGFRGNTFNLNHLLNGDAVNATECMKKPGTASVFNSMYQKAGQYQRIKKMSFEEAMLSYYRESKENIDKAMGVDLKL